MVDIIKAALDISFYEPFCSSKSSVHLLQSRMTAPVRTKTVRVVAENWFVYGLKNLPYCVLHQFITEGRYSKRTDFSVALGNIYAPDRLRLIAQICEFSNDGLHIVNAKAVRRVVVSTFRRCTVVCIKALIGFHINVLSQQISVQPRKDTFGVIA